MPKKGKAPAEAPAARRGAPKFPSDPVDSVEMQMLAEIGDDEGRNHPSEPAAKGGKGAAGKRKRASPGDKGVKDGRKRLNAYTLFVQEQAQRRAGEKDTPKLAATDAMRENGELWKKMSDAD